MSVITDRFEVEREVGTGGMGTVFRAIDRETGAAVALKVLQKQLHSETERFLLEARVLAQLQHPGIVRYVSHGVTSEGAPFIAMEWLEGEDLWSRLQRRVFTVEETVQLGKRVADALASAHAQGIVHRDIKPSNIFIQGAEIDDVKLLDFGVARIIDLQRQLTMTGTFLGTPAYTAPEQARGERQVGPEADVFSLGCVLFECLTGRGPFDADNVMAVLTKLLMEQPARIRDARRDVPEPVSALIERMIAKDPKKRPASGSVVVAELNNLAWRETMAAAMASAAAPYGAVVPDPHSTPAERLARSGLMRRAPDAPPPSSASGSGVESKMTPSPFESQVTHIQPRIDMTPVSSRPAASRPSSSLGRRYKLMGFAASLVEHREKPTDLSPVSDKVYDILAKYISMPWAMMQSHCTRLGKDPHNLATADLPVIADALAKAVATFAGQKGSAAMREEIKSLAIE
jgi:serine/threonine protein kinase